MLTFGKVVGGLATLVGVVPDRRDRFQARLKQLQRMGFPPGVNVGRYAKASYGPGQVIQLAAALELIQTGFSPERAIKTVLSWWDHIRRAVLLARDSGELVNVVFLPKDFGGLTSATTESEDDRIAWTGDGAVTIKLSGPEDPDLQSDLAQIATAPRAVMLNVTHMVSALTQGLDAEGADTELFWAETNPWRSEKDWAGRPIGTAL